MKAKTRNHNRYGMIEQELEHTVGCDELHSVLILKNTNKIYANNKL